MRYLTFSLTFFGIWVLIFIFKKNLRKEMAIASFLLLSLVFFEPFFVPDYWLPDTILNPKLSIEDFIISFSVSGISAVVYEIVLGKHVKHFKLKHTLKKKIFDNLLLFGGLLTTLVLFFLFKLTFIYASLIGSITSVIILYLIRQDLLQKIFFSSILFGLLYLIIFSIFSSFLFPDFINMWNIRNLSGVLLFGVPLEEILWGFSVGALAGPLYEYVLSFKLVSNK